MAKRAPVNTLDAELDYIAACDKMVVCSAEPTTYAEANATYALASVTMTPTTDFPKSGTVPAARVLTVAAKSAISVTTTGSATHVAVIRTADSSLRYVTTCTSQALTSGNTVSVPAWTVSMTQPT